MLLSIVMQIREFLELVAQLPGWLLYFGAPALLVLAGIVLVLVRAERAYPPVALLLGAAGLVLVAGIAESSSDFVVWAAFYTAVAALVRFLFFIPAPKKKQKQDRSEEIYETFHVGLDEEMPIIDGSTSTLPITQAVYSALFTNGDRHPANPVTHSKSHSSYERLINGEVDMLFASVYPASDILALAEEKGVELELIPIAHDAMIFFTNKDNPATGLTSEQISNIYVNNAYDNWNQIGGPDALLYPYCRNNDSGSHAQMERHFLHGAEIHETIRQETTSYAMQSILTDVIDAQTSDPTGYALGYSIYYYYWNANMVLGTADHLKLLEIDGVAPTDETIADGSYPLSNNTYVVLRKDTPEDAPARRLADFMLTEAGQRCVENAGYGPLQ